MGNGGGVAIYAAPSVSATSISSTYNDTAIIQIPLDKEPLTIATRYYAPNIPLDLDALKSLTKISKQYIIAGDLNCKHTFFGSYKTNFYGDQLFDFTEEHSLYLANDTSQSTYLHSAGSSDLIDLFLLSKTLSKTIEHCEVGDDIGSDHLPVHLWLSPSGLKHIYCVNMGRPLIKCNWSLFRETLDQFLDNIQMIHLSCPTGIETLVSDLTKAIQDSLDEICFLRPIKTFRYTLSQEVLALTRTKRRIRRILQKYSSPTLITISLFRLFY